jgi:hypothetical protein
MSAFQQLLTRRRSMIIEMQRQWIAAETKRTDPEDVWGVCGRAFEEPSVVAVARTDDRTDMGVACSECVEYLGRRNPEKFPTIEVYRDLLAIYPQAMYPSAEVLEAAGEAAGY